MIPELFSRAVPVGDDGGRGAVDCVRPELGRQSPPAAPPDPAKDNDGRGRLAASFAGPPDEPRDERGRWTSHGYNAAQIAGMSHAQRRALAGVLFGLKTKGMGEEELRKKLTPKEGASQDQPASSGLPAPERKAALEELMAAYLRGEREGGLDPRGDLKHLPGGDRLAAAETAVNRIVAEHARKTSVGVPVESLYQQLQQSGTRLTPAEFRAVLLSIHRGGRQRLGAWPAPPYQIPRPDLSPVVSGKIMAWVHQGSGAGFSAVFFDSDQPRDDAGRWTTAGAALVAANPTPKDRPPPAPLFPEPGNVTHAAAVKATAEYGVAYHRARTVEVVRRMLTEPDAPAVPVPPADAPKGKRVAAARKAVELAAAAKDDLRQLTNPHPEAVAANRAVAASHPHGPAALEAARAEAARRHAAAKAVVESHIAALPDDLRAKARKAAEAAFSRPGGIPCDLEGVGGAVAEFYSPDQPRDDRGRWSEGAGSGAARLHYADAVRQFARAGGPASASEVAAVAGHLSRLTVAQLHDLRREHGLRASSPDKAGLVRKLAERFAAHRAANKAVEKPAEKLRENLRGPSAAAPHPSGATIDQTHDGYHVVRSPSGMALKAFKTRQEAERYRDALPAHKPADPAERAAREKDAAARRLAAAEAAAREHPHREDVRDELRAAGGVAGSGKAAVPMTTAERSAVQTNIGLVVGSGKANLKTEQELMDLYKADGLGDMARKMKSGPEDLLRRAAGIVAKDPGATGAVKDALSKAANVSAPPPDARGRLSAGPVNPLRDKPATSEARHSADAVQRMSVAELRDAATRTQGGRLSPGVHAHIHAMAEAERRLKTGKDSRGAAISEGEKERLQRSLIEGKAKLGKLLRGERAAFAADEPGDGRGRLTG